MKPPCNPLLEPLRILNRLWSDADRTFYLFFAAPIENLQFGFMQTCKPGKSAYWESFRLYVVDDRFVKLNPVSEQRNFGEYDLKTTDNLNETTFVFENHKNERERVLSFSYDSKSQQLFMKVMGIRDDKNYESTWMASAV